MTTTAEQTQDQGFLRRIAIVFSLCLLLVVVLELVGYRIEAHSVRAEASNAVEVSAAGEARMLTQRVALLAFSLLSAEAPELQQKVRAALADRLFRLGVLIEGLAHGDPDLRLKPPLSLPRRKLLFDRETGLYQRTLNFIGRGREVLDLPGEALATGSQSLLELATQSTILLEAYERFTNQIREEGVQGVLRLQRISLSLLYAKLAGIFSIALLLFVPMFRKLSEELEARTAAERDLNQTVEDLREFAGIIAHDLRAPLRNISGFSDFLRERVDGRIDSEAQEYLDYIRSSVGRLDSMITDLLRYARTGAKGLSPQALLLPALVEELQSDLGSQLKEKQAKLDVRGGLPVRADKTLLRQLLQNLIQNSIKYSRDDCILEIEVRTVRNGGDRIEVIYRDNGTGFREEEAAHIFRAFRRLENARNKEGTGIGLAICEKIVRLHGGTISAAPHREGGALFRFDLPAAEK